VVRREVDAVQLGQSRRPTVHHRDGDDPVEGDHRAARHGEQQVVEREALGPVGIPRSPWTAAIAGVVRAGRRAAVSSMRSSSPATSPSSGSARRSGRASRIASAAATPAVRARDVHPRA
jgi:hypothetical protein